MRGIYVSHQVEETLRELEHLPGFESAWRWTEMWLSRAPEEGMVLHAEAELYIFSQAIPTAEGTYTMWGVYDFNETNVSIYTLSGNIPKRQPPSVGRESTE